MQGKERADRQLLDAQTLAGHLVPAGSMFAFLAAHRGGVFPDADYADLFAPPGVGRAPVPATQMAAVVTLQTLHGYSGREAAGAVRCDVRWKVACGLAVDDEGFGPSSLVCWRQRIARPGRPHRVNDAVRKIVAETGVVRGRRRRAVGSTVLAGGAATRDTVTQLIWAIRRVAREVPGAAGRIAAVCTGHDYSKPGKPQIGWDDPQAKDALVPALVNDANAVVGAFEDAELGESAASALALLALVAGQDVGPAGGSDGTGGRWRIARKVAGGRTVSTVGPDARHTRKSPEVRRGGYRAHVAAGPGTGVITDEKLTKAAGQESSGPAVAGEFVAAGAGTPDAAAGGGTGSAGAGQRPGGAGQPEDSRDGGDLSWYGGSAYGTGDLRGAIEQAGHQAVIKPKPPRPAVEGGFTVGDFAVDEDQGTVTCPAGHTVALSRTRVATLGALCRGCPLRQRCTTCKTGRKLVLHPRDDLLRRARADWAATGLRKDHMAWRPNVERAVARVATWRGRRLKLRYRGVASNHAWLKRRTAALNLRNLPGRRLAREGGAWVLAT